MQSGIVDSHRGTKAPQHSNFMRKHSLHLPACDNDVRRLLLNTHLRPAVHIMYHIPLFLSILRVRKQAWRGHMTWTTQQRPKVPVELSLAPFGPRAGRLTTLLALDPSFLVLPAPTSSCSERLLLCPVTQGPGVWPAASWEAEAPPLPVQLFAALMELS